MNIAPLIPPPARYIPPEWKRKPPPEHFDIRADLLAAALRERRSYVGRSSKSIGLFRRSI